MDNIGNILNDYKNYILLSIVSLYFIRYFFLTGVFTTLKKNMKGKVVIVTGGANGIGFAAALLLAVHGASVYIFDLERENPQDAARQIDAHV